MPAIPQLKKGSTTMHYFTLFHFTILFVNSQLHRKNALYGRLFNIQIIILFTVMYKYALYGEMTNKLNLLTISVLRTTWFVLLRTI